MPRLSEGVFAGLGGDVVIHVDIVPDVEILQDELLTIAGNLEDTMRPMLTARNLAQEDVQAHFDSESGPDGMQWVELNKEYLREKEAAGHRSEILQRTGDLMEAAVSDEAYVITPQGLWFNWDALPETPDGHNVGKLQQTGQAGYVTTVFEGQSVRSKAAVDADDSHMRTARPFVGLSDFMQDSVMTVFDVWFDEATQVTVNPKTGVMQHRVGNRFGPKVRL